MLKIASVSLALAFWNGLTGCGRVVNFPKTNHDSHDVAGTAIAPTSDAVVESEPVPLTASFEGFVTAAFSVWVDGTSYQDIEEFYTSELNQLEARVRQAGYGEEWKPRLEAELGFRDLWRNMTVYLAPVDLNGFRGQTRVDETGHFALELPRQALGHAYQVRANKRIALILESEGEAKRLCYNFSALDMTVAWTEESLPVGLEKFETSLTAYDCAVPDGSLDVPGQRP